jgi:hypothetical protein
VLDRHDGDAALQGQRHHERGVVRNVLDVGAGIGDVDKDLAKLAAGMKPAVTVMA